MKSKKLIALGLAVVTTAALAAPAFAADTVINGMYKQIKIDVEIPTVGKAVINPYNMPVKAEYVDIADDNKVKELSALTTAGKIATQPLIGISTCEVALDVGATVTGTPKGDLMLAAKDLTGLKTKSAVVYLECKQDMTLVVGDVAATDPAVAADKAISGIKGAKAVDAFNAWPASTYNFNTDAAAEKANSDKVLVGTTAKNKAKLCTLAAALPDATDNNKLKPQQGSFLLARLGGDVVQNPTEAWTTQDGVSVNVAFTFTPAEPKEGGTIELNAGANLATCTVKVNAPEGVTFGATGVTYDWKVVDIDSNASTITAGTAGTATIAAATGSSLTASKKCTVTCTVTDVTGIKYVSEDEITLPAT